MPVEILPEGYADWIEFDDEPNILFMGEDPFWKTKTGGSDVNLAILYRGGPGFLDRSTDGGRTWASIIPSTSPDWFVEDDYYRVHQQASYGTEKNLCVPGRPSPAPANGNVDYMASSGSLANSGSQDVLVRHTIAAGAGSFRPTYTGWILYTTDDFVTHDWLQLNFNLNDPNDQITVGSEFSLADWHVTAGPADYRQWSTPKLVQYTDSVYGVHMELRTATLDDVTEHVWFEVDFNTSTKAFTTPNSTDPDTGHDVNSSGDPINTYYGVDTDVVVPVAVYNGDAYGGGRIRDRTGAGQPIWAHVGVSRYIESGGNILQLPDGTVTVSFKFAKEDDIKRAMALLTRIQGREYRPHSIRNTKSYIALAVYIYDALSVSDVVDGATTVTSALKRAHAWHRDNAQVLAQRHMTPIEPGLTDKKTLTAVPPIELPSNKNIRFLATVQDVVDEGKEMGHCVGGYWDRAVKGKEYLFHIEYKGEQATASVSSASGYVQCLGPNNYVNSASIYGEKLLKSWARSLPNIGVNVTHKIADFIALPLAAEEIPF
jgi:hypothetical protein